MSRSRALHRPVRSLAFLALAITACASAPPPGPPSAAPTSPASRTVPPPAGDWPERSPGPPALAIEEDTTPLTALELAGQAVFGREGCGGCHSLKEEPDPVPGEEPWRRDPKHGPSLRREAGKYPHLWHVVHLLDPRAVTPGSTMPAFPQLARRPLASTRDAVAQASAIVADLAAQGRAAQADTELIAVVAYLQRLGRAATASRTPTLAARPPQLELERRLREHAASPAARARGEALFHRNCAPCHGAEGQGLIGPNLTDAHFLHGGSALATFDAIADGFPARGMPAWAPVLGAEGVRALTAFVHGELRRRTPTVPGKAPQGVPEP